MPAPAVCRLLHALYEDAARGQPHGTLVGDSIFIALAGLLASAGIGWRGYARPGTADWRTRRALEYIHAHLTDHLNVQSIAAAAGSSPFHLSRQFPRRDRYLYVAICLAGARPARRGFDAAQQDFVARNIVCGGV